VSPEPGPVPENQGIGFGTRPDDDHEAASADVTGLGKQDGQGESHGDGGVDGVPALSQDVGPDVGGPGVFTDDDAPPRKGDFLCTPAGERKAPVRRPIQPPRKTQHRKDASAFIRHRRRTRATTAPMPPMFE
jgi:hypothetical protein